MVDDCSGQPLPETSVSVVGTTDGAITDSLGTFAFETAAEGEQSLQASLVCYHTARQSVTLRPRGEESVDFRLVPTGDTLTDIVGNVVVCECGR